MFFAREVGKERRYRGVDGARPLDRTADNHHFNVMRHGGNKTANGKQHEAEINYALASIMVGGHPKGQLKNRLSQTIDTQREPNQDMGLASRQMLGINVKNRKDQEHAEHS